MIKLKITVSDLNLLLDYFTIIREAIQREIKKRKRYSPEQFLSITELYELQVMVTKFQIKRINSFGHLPSKKLTISFSPTQANVFMKYNSIEQTKSSTALSTTSTAIILNYSGFIHKQFINLI